MSQWPWSWRLYPQLFACDDDAFDRGGVSDRDLLVVPCRGDCLITFLLLLRIALSHYFLRLHGFGREWRCQEGSSGTKREPWNEIRAILHRVLLDPLGCG